MSRLIGAIRTLAGLPPACVLEIAQGSHIWESGRTVVNDDCTIACSSCSLSVSLALEEGALRLAYDFDHWRRSCCCAHFEGPGACPSFVELHEFLRELPNSPKR
jgi:hypothetical protein